MRRGSGREVRRPISGRGTRSLERWDTPRPRPALLFVVFSPGGGRAGEPQHSSGRGRLKQPVRAEGRGGSAGGDCWGLGRRRRAGEGGRRAQAGEKGDREGGSQPRRTPPSSPQPSRTSDSLPPPWAAGAGFASSRHVGEYGGAQAPGHDQPVRAGRGLRGRPGEAAAAGGPLAVRDRPEHVFPRNKHSEQPPSPPDDVYT